MYFFLGLLSIGFGAFLIKFREACADAVGEPAWAMKIGGMPNVIVLLGIFFCFWGLATMTGTSDILFAPITHFLPGISQKQAVEGF